MNGMSMPLVSGLSGAVCVCQLVTCSHLKPAASGAPGSVASWVSLLKDSLQAGFLTFLLRADEKAEPAALLCGFA